MFNWSSPSVNPLPHFTPPPPFAWIPARFLSGLWSVCILFLCVYGPFFSDVVSILLLLLCSVLRAAFTNNRVPVLQRCGSLKETLSQGHGVRSTGQGGPKDGAILAQTKGYHGEKVISSFEASRKRLLSPQEQEETAWNDRERGSHPEKRARISAGESLFPTSLSSP